MMFGSSVWFPAGLGFLP